MSEEKQIEEMARIIDDNHGFIVSSVETAKALYNAGYRKQSKNTVEVVRCKDCEYHHWEQEPCHGKTIHKCSVLNSEVFKDFYCYHGRAKMKGGGKE